jgi:hypothetical protein
MGQVFFQNLTGANCRLSGQAIVSLQVSEDIDADYDTASAVCLAPDGLYGAGSVVETIEGGTSTGWWEVEDPVQSVSGEKTWRRRAGTAGYTHIPLVSYKLRRKGYMSARSTLSRGVVPSDSYPPKFMEAGAYNSYRWELYQQWQERTLDGFEMRKQLASWRVVGSAAQIIQAICGWVGLSYNLRTGLANCAPTYIPVDKPAITAIREVASWSGASVMLDRNGVLQIFNWEETFGRGGSTPSLRAVTEYEVHYGLPAINHVSVVGTTYSERESTGTWYKARKTYPIEVTESLSRAPGEKIVSDRIEIRDYVITPNLARGIARERLARAWLSANSTRFTGPAEGAQSVRPLSGSVLNVSRTLAWNGQAYRYEIAVMFARAAVPFAGAWSSVGTVTYRPGQAPQVNEGWW